MAAPLAAAGAGVSAADDAASMLPAALAGVPERTLATFQEAFTSFAHNGILLRTDLGPCLRTLGYHVTEAETRRSFEELSTGGKLEYMGFLVIVARQLTAVQTPDAMIRSFEIFDADLKGYVTTGEFRSIMSKLGDAPLPPTVVDEMISYADPEDTGQIEYATFVRKLFGDVAAHEKAKSAAAAAAKAGGKTAAKAKK